jgi:hypothetical protein
LNINTFAHSELSFATFAKSSAAKHESTRGVGVIDEVVVVQLIRKRLTEGSRGASDIVLPLSTLK